MITPTIIHTMAPQCLDPEAWADALNAASGEFEITTDQRAAHFLGQVVHETAGLTKFEENLHYSAGGLRATFSPSRISDADCQRYGKTADHPSDPEGIANCIYGGVWGLQNLGNTEPGDGWMLHGRGPLQDTGRANYLAAGVRIGVNLIADPTRLLVPLIGARASAAFWMDHGLNQLADNADLLGISTTISKKVNGGLLGLEERRSLTSLAFALLTTST